MKEILMYIWQLPLNILGLVYKIYLGSKLKKNFCTEEYEIYLKDTKGSIALGRYVFLDKKAYSGIIVHKIGHTKLSRILGPLYIPLITLPSYIWYKICKGNENLERYDKFFTEVWENNLMGI